VACGQYKDKEENLWKIGPKMSKIDIKKKRHLLQALKIVFSKN